MTDAAVTELQPSVLDSLRQIAGNDHVLTDAEDLQFYSSDVLREADPAEVVLQPGTKEELEEAIPGLQSLPTYILISPDWTIEGTFIGATSPRLLRKEVEKLLEAQ